MNGTRLRLRVSPGATRAGVVGRHGDGWKVRVAAPPEGGRANEAVLSLLAERLELPRRAVSIVSGHAGREKVVQMGGITQADSERRLEEASQRRRLRRRPQDARALLGRPSEMTGRNAGRQKVGP